MFETIKMDEWEMESGKDKKELHEIGTMTVYKDVSYVEVKIKNKKMGFKVPEDVAGKLLA